MVGEGRSAMTGALGLRDPELDAVHGPVHLASAILGVGDPLAGRHEIQLSRSDRLFIPKAVGVQHLTLEEPRDGVETDVWMRSNGHRPFGSDLDWTEPIEEAPCSHGPVTAQGKGPVHRQSTDAGHVTLRDHWIDGQGRAFRRPSAARFLQTF
jgi:hypothetical protein